MCSVTHSCLTLCKPMESVAHQAPLSMGFSKQLSGEYRNGLPFPPPGDLPDPRIKPMSPASPPLEGEFFTSEPPGKPIGSLTLGRLRNISILQSSCTKNQWTNQWEFIILHLPFQFHSPPLYSFLLWALRDWPLRLCHQVIFVLWLLVEFNQREILVE